MSGINGLGPGGLNFNTMFGVGNTPGVGTTQQTGQGNGVAGGPLPPSGGDMAVAGLFGGNNSGVNVPPGAEQRLADAMNMLTSGGGGSITQMIGAMMIKMAAEQRQNALENRTAAYEQQKAALDGQASEMREAADKMMSGAILSLVLTVVSAAMSTAIGFMNLKQQASSIKDMSNATSGIQAADKELGKLGDVGKDTDKLTKQGSLIADKAAHEAAFKISEAKANVAQMKNQILNSLGEAIQGAASAGGKMYDAQAKYDDAEAQERAAMGTVAAQQGDMAKEVQQNMKDMMAAIISFLKELSDAEVEQMRSITRA